MQLPSTDELVLVSGLPPIRANKARYFEDDRLANRVLPIPALPRPGAGTCGDRSVIHADDWSTRPLPDPGAATDGSVTGFLTHEDPANGGIRREPGLPRHEAVAPEDLKPEAEFALLDDEPDERARERITRKKGRWLARQAALDPGDGLGL